MKSVAVPSKNTQTKIDKNKSCCCAKKLSYSCKVRSMVTICLILLATAAALIYFLLSPTLKTFQENQKNRPERINWTPQCSVKLLSPSERFNCFPENLNVDQTACENRGCCYVETFGETNATSEWPKCSYPKNYGYEVAGKSRVIFNGFEIPLRRLPAPSRYGDDIHLLHMKVEMQTKYRLRIKFYDSESSRYEVPVPKVPVHTSSNFQEQNSREIFLYSVTYNTVSSPFAVKIRRSDTDTVLFDTSAGALVFANQFLELSTFLPSLNIYGLQQPEQTNYHHDDFNWKTWSLFSSNSEEENSRPGVHPMYLCLENDGNAHGVLLLNSNAMEIELHPSPGITFRAIGGILDFYLFLGPSPEDVVQQYSEAIGRSMMPPYWSLGLHVGQFTYQSTKEVEDFVNEFTSKYIPMESVFLSSDIVEDYFAKSAESWDLSNLTSELHNKNQKLIFIQEPGIPKDILNRDSAFSLGLQQDIFVTDKWGTNPIEGERNGDVVAYPDYGRSSAVLWLADVIKKTGQDLDFDGFWLIDNEPANDIDGSTDGCLDDNLNQPPYMPKMNKGALFEKTLCMDAIHYWREDARTHYDLHSLYGHSMVMGFEQALSFSHPQKRKLILSDSTFVGTGHFAGHWITQIPNSWKGLKLSIPAVMEMQLHGVPFSGVSFCENEESEAMADSEQLCLRWLQLSIFYPLLQLHGTIEYFHSPEKKEFIPAFRNAVSRRYELLPYLYTLLFLSHTLGSTVIRPLFHEFPGDNETHSLSSQFMWGSALLISPILEKDATKIIFYVPSGLWYDFYPGASLQSSGEWFEETGGPFLDTKQPSVLHIRAGHIIPLQKPAETTAISRQNPMSLLVALNKTNQAVGSLFWDDGETKNSHLLGEYVFVEFSASQNSLMVKGHLGKKVFMSNFYTGYIQQVRIMGLQKPPKRIIIDESYILSNKQNDWNYDTKALDLKFILIPIARHTKLQWFF